MLTHRIPDGTLGITSQQVSSTAPKTLCLVTMQILLFQRPHKGLKHSSWEFTVISQKALRTTDIVQYVFIQIISPRILAPSHHPVGLYHLFSKGMQPWPKSLQRMGTPHSQKWYSSKSDVLRLLSKQSVQSFCYGRGRIGEFAHFVSSPSLYHI